MKMKEFLRRNYLSGVVFLTGAAVLVLEVAALRVLSPFFGNTLYSTSSVLAVILGALSLGYYAGGRISDKKPQEIVFFGIILLGGFFIVILNAISGSILLWSNRALTMTNGPLIASMAIFFLPALLLGMLSPFAVKLASSKDPERVGSNAGNIYFWSTLGSIFGSLLTGFVLIPDFGVSGIIASTGLLTVFLGGLPLLFLCSGRTARLRVLVALLLAIPLAALADDTRMRGALYSKDGVYQRITVIDTTLNGHPANTLLLDRNFSAAAYSDSEDIVLDYAKYFALYRALKPDSRRVLAIGGGGYTIPAAFLKERPEMNVDVAEIEPGLYDLAKKYFRAPSDPRLNNIVDDGRRVLARSASPYDVVFADAYLSLYSVPSHLVTREFFDLTKKSLAPDGILIANLIGDLWDEPGSFFAAEAKTIRSVFPNAVFFGLNPGTRGFQNIIAVAWNGDKKMDIKDWKHWGIRNGFPNMDERILPDGVLFGENDRILTDDFAPADYMMAASLNRLGI